MYDLNVNGEDVFVDVPPGTSLLSVLRDTLSLRGSKEACGRGECGACTVLYGGKAVASCVMLIDLVSKPIWTIEGLAPDYEELRARWADHGGFQCGFCTPGYVVRAISLEQENIEGEASLRHALGGNICRCTGYMGLVDAILNKTTDRLDDFESRPEDWRGRP